jgi:carbon monoxide dehydrogenase subunit G
MESKFESKIGQIASTPEKIYNFLGNFNNFKHLVPPDKVKNWESGEEWCSFEVDMLGKTGMQITEKQPHSLIKITGAEGSKFDFFLWIQLKEAAPYDTRLKLTMQVELNPMMKMMVAKPLQSFLDTLVDQLSKVPY